MKDALPRVRAFGVSLLLAGVPRRATITSTLAHRKGPAFRTQVAEAPAGLSYRRVDGPPNLAP
jgi:hypothetical protein